MKTAEPVMIVTLAMAMMHLAISFGIPITDPQIEAIKIVVETAVLILGFLWARSQVTPVATPPVEEAR